MPEVIHFMNFFVTLSPGALKLCGSLFVENLRSVVLSLRSS